MLARSVQPHNARLRGAAAVRNGRGFPLTPLPRASVLRHCSSGDPPDAAQQQPSKAASKSQRTGLVSIAGDLHLHIDAINVHLTGSSPPQAGQQDLASAVKSAVMDAIPSAVAAHLPTLPTPTEQPAPHEPDLESVAPLVPPFTCTGEVNIPAVTALAMCSDGHHFVCGHLSGEVALWDVRNPGQRLVAALGNKKCVYSVAVSADCGRVLVGCKDGLWLWDVGKGPTTGLMKYDVQYSVRYRGHQRYLDVSLVAMTPDGRYGVSGGWKDGLRVCRVWDLEKGECIGSVDTISDVVSVGISPSGQTATALVEAPRDPEDKYGGGRGRLQVWKWHAGSGFSTPVELQGDALGAALSLSADGGMALAAGRGDVHRLDVRSGEKEAAFTTQAGGGFRLALSTDGRCAVLGTYGGKFSVLDVEGRACLATLPAHQGHAIRCLAISSDGRHAASYSEDDGRLRIWHLG